MRKRVIYIIAPILIGITNSAFIYGQKTDLEKLQGKTWIYQWDVGYEDEGGWKMKYDCCKETYTLYSAKKEYPSYDFPFYLSNQIETQFVHSKVGSVQNGRYMIYSRGTAGTSVQEILKLTETELTMQSIKSGNILSYRALEYFTMKYVLDNTLKGTLPFAPTKKTGFLEGYNFPINSTTIPDRLHTCVQLTSPTNNASAARGKFFRKFTAGSYNLVIVTFGDLTKNRTDVLCIVDNNGTIRSTLEGWVTVDGMAVKSYSIQGNGDVYISRIVPSSSTSLSFGNIDDSTVFSGNVETAIYSTSGGSFVYKETKAPSLIKTFTRELMSDPSKEVGGY